MKEKKYKIITYGCQMNVHESEKLAGIVRSMGFSECDDDNDADLIIFNTCCIRQNAEERAKGNIGALKNLKKAKPNLLIAVGGCMTQRPGEAEKLHEVFPFVDIIFGTHNLEKFKDLLLEKYSQKHSVVDIVNGDGEVFEGTEKYRTSYPNAWVNVMYGCNNFCTYCIVPYVRGRERSRKPENIIEECRQLICEGYKEITLLGQNVNSYGKDLGINYDFANLITHIGQLEGKFRLRFMTNHPKDFSHALIEAIANTDKACHCVHLPLQSGSDRILSMMNRHYTREEYLKKIEDLRRCIPDCSITTDIMVGFPGETERDFLDTLDVIKKVEFNGAFTFVYSPRPGTKAAEMSGQIDEETSKRRIMRMISVQNEINRKQSESYVGKTVEVLCEGYDEKRNSYFGRDVFGKSVYFTAENNCRGKFTEVKINKANGISLLGTYCGGN